MTADVPAPLYLKRVAYRLIRNRLHGDAQITARRYLSNPRRTFADVEQLLKDLRGKS